MNNLDKIKDSLFDVNSINLNDNYLNKIVKLIKKLNEECKNIKIVAFNSFDLYYDKQPVKNLYILLGFVNDDFGSKDCLEKTIKHGLNDIKPDQKNKWIYFDEINELENFEDILFFRYKNFDIAKQWFYEEKYRFWEKYKTEYYSIQNSIMELLNSNS